MEWELVLSTGLATAGAMLPQCQESRVQQGSSRGAAAQGSTELGFTRLPSTVPQLGKVKRDEG